MVLDIEIKFIVRKQGTAESRFVFASLLPLASDLQLQGNPFPSPLCQCLGQSLSWYLRGFEGQNYTFWAPPWELALQVTMETEYSRCA